MSAAAVREKRSFWDQPARRARHNRIYSGFVRWMRLILPLAAACFIGLLAVWPNVREAAAPVQKKVVAPQTVGQNELVNPRFKSVDSQNRPFTVTAARAVQSAQDTQTVLLEKPAAEMLLGNGAKVAARADSGTYSRKDSGLLLEGHVTLDHDLGYELTTSRLQVDAKTRQVWSDQPVSGQGPAGTLQAAGLQANDNDGQLIFTGPAKLVLKNGARGL